MIIVAERRRPPQLSLPSRGDRTRYSRLLGGKIEFSGRTPPRERKGETGWRRGLDSNSWLRFAGRSCLIGPQSAYSACLRQTESPNQESGRLDSGGSQCETNAYCGHFQSQRACKAVLWERNRAFESNLLRQSVSLFLSLGGVLPENSILPPKAGEYHTDKHLTPVSYGQPGLAICSYFSETGSGSGVSRAILNHRFALTDRYGPNLTGRPSTR